VDQSKYLEYTQYWSSTKKTYIVNVYSRQHRSLLGIIRWYGAWRQYAFFPTDKTIWNTDCLEEIQEKINELMNERKASDESSRDK
jgi:hypothetical protein